MHDGSHEWVLIGGTQNALQNALLLSPLSFSTNILDFIEKSGFYAVKSLWSCNDQYTSKSEIKDQITFSLCSSLITHVQLPNKIYS